MGEEREVGVLLLLRVAAPFIAAQRGVFVAALVLKTVGDVVFLAVPSVIKAILDVTFSSPSSSSGGDEEDKATRLCQVLLVLYLVRAVLSHAGGVAQRVAGERLAASMRHALFVKLQHVAAEMDSPQGTAASLSAMQNDVSALQDAAAVSFFHAVLGSVYALGGLGLCLRMSARLVAVVAAFVLPTLWGARCAKRPLAARGRRVTRAWAEVAASVEGALRHATVVAAFGGEGREADRCKTALREYMRAVQSQARLEGFIGAATFYAQSVALVGVVWFGTIEARSGNLTAGVLVALVYYITEVAKSVEKVMHHVSQLHAATGAAARVVRLLKGLSTSSTSDVQKAWGRSIAFFASPNAPALEFCHVKFSYDTVKPVLDGVTFAVHGGEQLAIVGPSGGGKSTILKVALRLLTPANGSYLLGGEDALSMPIDVVRRMLGWVPQEPVIFSGTVHENVMYGSWHLEENGEDGHQKAVAAVSNALRAAHAYDFVADMPEGTSTMIGPGSVEGGSRGLSGGQAALICIARAIIRNPRVLCLDEPSAALDADSERAILSTLRKHCVASMPRVACLVCAHRLGPTIDSEGVMVLQEGRVVESGRPDELLTRKQSEYRRMMETWKGGVRSG